MFKVKRTKRVKETLALCDENGEVVQRIEIDFDADAIAKVFNQRWNDLIAAELTIKEFEKDGSKPEQLGEAWEAYGHAVVAMFRLVFGDDGAETVCNFYENNPTEMLEEVFPFITDVVLPKIKEVAKEKSERLKKNYEASKLR